VSKLNNQNKMTTPDFVQRKFGKTHLMDYFLPPPHTEQSHHDRPTTSDARTPHSSVRQLWVAYDRRPGLWPYPSPYQDLRHVAIVNQRVHRWGFTTTSTTQCA